MRSKRLAPDRARHRKSRLEETNPSTDSGAPCLCNAHSRASFPRAKVATLRSGGPFPFLSAADEVSMHVELHMRRCGLFAAASKRETASAPSAQGASLPTAADASSSSKSASSLNGGVGERGRLRGSTQSQAPPPAAAWSEVCEGLPRSALCFVRQRHSNGGAEEDASSGGGGAWSRAEPVSDCSSRSSVTSCGSQGSVSCMQSPRRNATGSAAAWLPVVCGGGAGEGTRFLPKTSDDRPSSLDRAKLAREAADRPPPL